MANDFTGSTPVSVGVLIHPHSGDDWVNSPPFDTPLGATDICYLLASTPNLSVTGATPITGKLMDIGTIDQKVDIFGGKSKVVEDRNYIKSVGGVAKTNSVNIVFENVNRDVKPNKLLGRKMIIILYSSSTMDFNVNDLSVRAMTGKAFKAEADRNTLTVTIRGLSQEWDQLLGTISNVENTSYKSKIYPMHYGDLSDSQAYMPVVLTKDTRKIPKIVLDDKPLKAVTDYIAWNEPNKTNYGLIKTQAIAVGPDNNYLSLDTTGNNYLIADNGDSLDLWNPYRVAFELEQMQFSLHEHTPSVKGSLYEELSSGKKFIYLGLEDGYYVFAATDIPDNATGTLRGISNVGDLDIEYTYHTPLLDPEITILKGSMQIRDGGSTTPLLIVPSAINTEDNFIRLADEDIYLLGEEVLSSASDEYIGSRYFAVRAQNNTIRHNHSAGTLIKNAKDRVVSNSRFLAEHEFTPLSISSLDWVGQSGTISAESSMISDYSLDIPKDFFKTNVLSEATISFIKSPVDERFTSDMGLIKIDFVFPEIDISAEVVKMYFRGKYGFDWSDAKVVTHETIVSAYTFLTKSGQSYSSLAEQDYFPAPDYDIVRMARPPAIGEWPGSYWLRYYDEDWVLTGSKRAYSLEDPGAVDLERLWGFNNLALVYVYSIFGISKYNRQVGWLNNHPCSVDNSHLILGQIDDTLYNKPVDDKYIYELTGEDKINQLSELNDKGYSLCHYLHFGWNTDPYEFKIKFTNPIFVIRFYVDPVTSPIWVRGQGRLHQTGDVVGTAGSLIENPVGVIEDLFRREVGGTQVDFQSVNTAEADSAGMKAAFSIYGDQQKFLDICNDICRQFNLILTEDSRGSLCIYSLNKSETVKTILNSHILTRNNVVDYSDNYTDIDKIVTDLNIKYAKRETDGEYTQVIGSSSIIGASNNLAEALATLGSNQPATLELNMVRDLPTAQLIGGQTLAYRYRPLRILTVPLSLNYADINIGEFVDFENETYIKGTTGNKYLVMGKKLMLPINNRAPKTELTLIERTEEDDPIIVETYSSSLQYQEAFDNSASIQEVHNGGS